MTIEQDLEDALDAVEMMVGQYLYEAPEGGYDHSFMSAGEYACEVMARLRPQQWRLTPTGMMSTTSDIRDPRTNKTVDRVTLDETGPELKQALDRSLERAQRKHVPDPDHLIVSWSLDQVADIERHSTVAWAFSAVHHFLVSGAEWVLVERIDDPRGNPADLQELHRDEAPR